MQARQVGPLDAAYLALDGPRTVGHVCLILPLDGPITLAQLREQVGARVGRLPELRQKLHQGANGGSTIRPSMSTSTSTSSTSDGAS